MAGDGVRPSSRASRARAGEAIPRASVFAPVTAIKLQASLTACAPPCEFGGAFRFVVSPLTSMLSVSSTSVDGEPSPGKFGFFSTGPEESSLLDPHAASTLRAATEPNTVHNRLRAIE